MASWAAPTRKCRVGRFLKNNLWLNLERWSKQGGRTNCHQKSFFGTPLCHPIVSIVFDFFECFIYCRAILFGIWKPTKYQQFEAWTFWTPMALTGPWPTQVRCGWIERSPGLLGWKKPYMWIKFDARFPSFQVPPLILIRYTVIFGTNHFLSSSQFLG